MSMEFKIDASQFISGANALNQRALTGVRTVGVATAQSMQDYAKNNHKWDNRTGSAESMLHADCKWSGTTLDISIQHGVDYGIWLEVRRDFKGKYKILEEARDSQVDTFVSMMKALKL